MDSETGWLVIDLPQLRNASGMQQGFLNAGTRGEHARLRHATVADIVGCLRAGGRLSNAGLLDNRGLFDSSGRLNNAGEFLNRGLLRLMGHARMINSGIFGDDGSGELAVGAQAVLTNAFGGALSVEAQGGMLTNGGSMTGFCGSALAGAIGNQPVLNACPAEDVIWCHGGTGDAAFWRVNGTRVAGTATPPGAPGDGYALLATGDFDGDGKHDILWRLPAQRQNRVWLLNGGSVRSNQLTTPQADTSWRVIGAGHTD